MKTQSLKSTYLIFYFTSLITFHSNGQIVYTDVNPDIGSTNYNLDLDNDGTTDFIIRHSTTTATITCGSSLPRTNHYIKVTPSGSNAVLTSSYISKLTANAVINGSKTWTNAANQTLENQTWTCIVFPGCINPCYAVNMGHGSWFNAVDGYMGLKLVKNNKSYYGWVRMSVTGATSFTIKDYAYNSQNNQSIVASQGANYALAQSLTGINICAGSSLIIPFTVQGSFNAGNVFTAELSNSSGSFSSPVAMGSVTSTTGGTLTALIPSGAAYGTAYRIRIRSSNPVQSSPPDNGTSLTIKTAQSATITTGGNPACGNTNLIASVATGNTFQWKLNGNNILSATNSSYSAKATGNYTCLVTNTCGSVVSNSINQVINPLPPGTITPAIVAEVCPGLTVTLKADTNSGLTYQWITYGGVAISGATSSSYTADSTSPYWVVETNSFGCTKTAPYTYVYIRKPLASISNNRPLTFCAGDSTVLNTTNSSAYQYQWIKNGTNIPGADHYAYTALNSGNYKVKVVNPSGSCDSVSNVKTVTVNCREGNNLFVEESEQLSIFPNPATNSVTIKFPSVEKGQVSIVNLFGQIVFSSKVDKEQIQIDVSKFPAGMYLASWSSGKKFETKTFSVIK